MRKTPVYFPYNSIVLIFFHDFNVIVQPRYCIQRYPQIEDSSNESFGFLNLSFLKTSNIWHFEFSTTLTV